MKLALSGLLLCAVALHLLPPCGALRPSARLSPLPPLLSLRGGGGSAVEEPLTHKQRNAHALKRDQKRAVANKDNKLKLYLMCTAIATTWFAFATFFFSRSEGWPLAQSFFFTVDTGMGIGFGAVEEQLQRTRAFTIINALVGASAVGGALALFADNIVKESSSVAATEFATAALAAAFARADTSGDGQLNKQELGGALKRLHVPIDAEALDATLRKFDSNGDGQISAAEFCDAVRPHRTPAFAELLTRRPDLEDGHEQG